MKLRKIKLSDFKDNRYLNIILFPVCVYNLITSYLYSYKEFKIFKNTIIENDNLYKSLVTMGISKDKYLFGYTSKFEYDKEIFNNKETIASVAKSKIINVIMEYVKDDNLLGILQVNIKTNWDYVIMKIKPSSWNLFKQDLVDFSISIILWAFLTFLYFIIF